MTPQNTTTQGADVEQRGTCQYAECSAPLPYQGRGRPRTLCEYHRYTEAKRHARLRLKKFRAARRAAPAV